MDTKSLVNLILSKYPSEYSNENAPQILEKSIKEMTPFMRRSIENFLINDQLDEINLLGYTVKILKNQHHMNEVAAYLTLDWILREPQKALQSLEKGHDMIYM